MAVSFQRPNRLKQIATAFRVNEDALQRGEPKMLSNAQRAGQLGAAISQLTTPFELSPAVPKAKAAIRRVRIQELDVKLHQIRYQAVRPYQSWCSSSQPTSSRTPLISLRRSCR